MSSTATIDVSACEREPIHVPGAIQSGGVLLVINGESESILQAGGDVSGLLGFEGAVVGRSLREVLGHSLADLLGRAGTRLGRRPISLGRINTGPEPREFVALAHEAPEGAILELQAAGPRVAADRVLAQLRAATDRLGAASELVYSATIWVRGARQSG